MEYLIIIFIICISLIFISLRHIKSGITSPAVITLSSWAIMSFVGYFSCESFDEFREESFYCLLIWISITSFVYISVELAQKHKSLLYKDYTPNRVCSRYSIFVIPACIVTAYEIYK